MHNAWITTSGEKMSKSLGNSLIVPEVLKQFRPAELRYYMVAAHYRSTVEFSFEALGEAATSYRRIENFLERAGGSAADGTLPAEFTEAMDDDLGTPAAMAAIHNAVREGNKLLAESDAGAARVASDVRAMLDVLGLDPADPHWADGSGAAEGLSNAVDVLVRALLDQRQAARAAKDFATADAIRDRIAEAGIEIEDTPEGPRWSI
jgi:cysteinyl-tRNA synthetase